MALFSSIQFIGTQRSGSNLLRLMLNQHQLISAPHPPHLLKTFVPLLSYYTSTNGQVSKDLIRDMCTWVEYNPVPWTGFSLDWESLYQPDTTIFEIFRNIYAHKAEIDRADIWCCKSTFNVAYTRELEEQLRPFYIYLYRDGRDVAVSFKKAIVGPKHIYHIARKWSAEQQQAIHFLDRIDSSRQIRLSYEELIHDPETSLKAICAKLGIGFASGMMRYYTSEESQHTADSGRMWKNVSKPIIANNTGKFKRSLTDWEIQLFEQLAGKELEALGYDRFSQSKDRIEIDEAYFDRVNSELIHDVINHSTKSELSNRARQERFYHAIHERLNIP